MIDTSVVNITDYYMTKNEIKTMVPVPFRKVFFAAVVLDR